jgi:hypothetical protein
MRQANGRFGRHVHFLGRHERTLGLVFEVGRPTVPEIRFAEGDVQNRRGMARHGDAQIPEALGQPVTPAQSRVVAAGAGDGAGRRQAGVEEEHFAEGGLGWRDGIGRRLRHDGLPGVVGFQRAEIDRRLFCRPTAESRQRAEDEDAGQENHAHRGTSLA